jgi:hypothetical protein
MKRYFESLRPADRSAIDSVPDGLFLVRVDRVQYHWHTAKPYYEIRFAVLEPKHLARPSVLHSQSHVETELVSTRLRL